MNFQFADKFTKFTVWVAHSLNLQIVIHTPITFFQQGDIIVLLNGKVSVQRENANVEHLCFICSYTYILIKIQIDVYVFVLISQVILNIQLIGATHVEICSQYQHLNYAGLDFERCQAPVPESEVSEYAEYFHL